MSSKTNTIQEVTPLSEKDCFYIADRCKTEFTYPIHCHKEYELNYVSQAKGVKRIVGDSIEIIDDYDLVLITRVLFGNEFPVGSIRIIFVY